MSELYVLRHNAMTMRILAGSKRSGDDTVKWPAELGTPQEQMLIEPTETVFKHTVVARSKTDDSKPHRVRVKAEDSVLDALSDMVLDHNENFFDTLSEDEVEQFYAGGKYEDDKITITIHKQPHTAYGLYGSTATDLKQGQEICSDHLSVPLYTLAQIQEAEAKDVLMEFTPAPLGKFLQQAGAQIKEAHYYVSQKPKGLDATTLISVDMIRDSVLDDAQKSREIIKKLTKAMGRAPTPVEQQKALDGQASTIRFSVNHAEERHVFMRESEKQPLPAFSKACLDHLMLNNTLGAYNNVRITICHKLASATDPAAAAMTIAGYLKHYINTNAEQRRFDGLIESMSKDLALSGNLPFIESMAQKINQGVPVFTHQREIVGETHSFLNQIRSDYSDLNMVTSAMLLTNKLNNCDDAAWLGHRAEHIENGHRQDTPSLATQKPR